jgi:hypothetical protein
MPFALNLCYFISKGKGVAVNTYLSNFCFSTPAYDYAPNPDKQWILQVTRKMQPVHRQFTDLLMTKRLQTLQSVDDAVEKVWYLFFSE